MHSNVVLHYHNHLNIYRTILPLFYLFDHIANELTTVSNLFNNLTDKKKEMKKELLQHSLFFLCCQLHDVQKAASPPSVDVLQDVLLMIVINNKI